MQENSEQPIAEETKKSQLEQAQEVLANIKKENELMADNLLRAEKLRAENLLSGQAEAGAVPEKPKEETAEEYAAKVMANDI